MKRTGVATSCSHAGSRSSACCSHVVPRARTAHRKYLYAVLLVSFVSGCIDGILVEDLRGAVTLADAGAPQEEDADVGEPDSDAAGGSERPDGGTSPGSQLDAGAGPRPDAGEDALRDGAAAPADAGGNQEAGCAGARCDGGAPVLGPCAACGPATLIGPAVSTDFADLCGNGAPKACWSNADGTCEMQCPSTESCSKDDPHACGAGRYCHFPRADCGASSAGFCAPAPSECMASVVVRVCGCDGRVYQNPCFAAKDGATAAYQGLPEENCK